MKRSFLLLILLLAMSTLAWPTTYFYPASRRLTPTPTPTSTAVVLTSTLTLTAASNGLTFNHYIIHTTTGPCVKLDHTTNITLYNFQIGPCGAAGPTQASGVWVAGGSGNKIYDSYIHSDHAGDATQANSHDGIYGQDTNDLTVQGNVIAFSEINLMFVNDTGGGAFGPFTANGNFLLNALGPFTQGSGQQIAFNGDNSGRQAVHDGLIENNRTLSCDATSTCTAHASGTGVFCLACSASTLSAFAGSISQYPIAEDSIGILGANTTTVTNNWVEGGDSPTGCGTALDIGSSHSTVTNNVYKDTGVCGLALANGENTINTMTGNVGQSSMSIISGQYGFLISHFGQPNYVGGTVNYANNKFSTVGEASPRCDPSISSCTYTTSDGFTGAPIACESPFFTCNNNGGNQFDNYASPQANPTVRGLLNPIATTHPPPLIPPMPKFCTAKSPFTTQTITAMCP